MIPRAAFFFGTHKTWGSGAALQQVPAGLGG